LQFPRLVIARMAWPVAAASGLADAAAIQVGNAPFAVAVNEAADTVCATGTSLSVISGRANTLTTAIPVRSGPGIAFSPATGTIFTGDNLGVRVSVIDATTNILASAAEVGIAPAGIAVNPETAIAYAVNLGANTISVIADT